MSLVTVISGDENLRQALAKVYVFHSPTDGKDREKALSAVAKEGGKIIQRIGSPTFIGAVIGIRPEIGGQWIKTQYDIAEGVLIKVFVQKKTSWNGILTTACQFLRIRESAPFYKVKVKLLNQVKTKLKTADITGRFDVLTLAEAQAYGATVAEKYESFFMPIITKQIFEVEMLESAVTTKEIMQTKTLPAAGKTPAVLIHRRRQKRSLEFRS